MSGKRKKWGKKKPRGPALIRWSKVKIIRPNETSQSTSTRFPFRATITIPQGTYEVEIDQGSIGTTTRFVRWLV